jgi:hypothetical protein
MPHILLTKVLEFIPKKTDMIFNDLNDNHMKSFLIEYREKIHSVKSILSVFSDNDSKKQNEVLANLLLCAPDQELANELLILARQGKQSNDYYQFIYKLDEEIIKKLNSRAQNESLVKEHVSSRIRIQNDMKRFHEKGEVMDIDTISLPNLFLLPRGYIDLMNFVNKNPDISLSNILKEV